MIFYPVQMHQERAARVKAGDKEARLRKKRAEAARNKTVVLATLRAFQPGP